jgi:fructokinase
MSPIASVSHTSAPFGAIEAGGTKFVCAIGDATGTLLEESRIDTRDPTSTLGQVVEYLTAAQARHGTLRAIGVGAFGPVDVRPNSSRFGCMLATPKPGWSQADLLAPLRSAFNVPLSLDTDVNAAAVGEWRWGAGRGLDSVAYVTIGTGIGAGVLHHGQAVRGLLHPEIGHVHAARHPADREFAGVCPFHGDCFEGLISGPAIVARTGRVMADAAPGDPVWELAAEYLGQLSALLVLTHCPERIIFGGGAMQPRLLVPMGERMRARLRGYPLLSEHEREDFIVLPGLGPQSGVKGALALAIEAGSSAEKQSESTVI